MIPDGELLRRYALDHSEEAFGELAQRHLNLVFSAALRQVNGDTHLAREVAQSVFTDLARKAQSLSQRLELTGWLYTSTYFAAAKAVRAEHRRRAYEKEAFAMNDLLNPSEPELDWEKLRPVLDQLMHKLNESDRQALLMRYFENRPLADIGKKLGISDDTARKRIDRALEKLRGVLSKRGIITAETLGAMLTAHAVETAPVGLATALTIASLIAASPGTNSSLAILKALSMTKLQTATFAALLAASAITSVLIEQSTQAKIRDTDLSLQHEAGSLPHLQSENKRLSNAIVWTAGLNNADDMAKLQSEITQLRARTNSLAALRQEHEHLQAALKKARNDLRFDPDLQVTTNNPEIRAKHSYGMSLYRAMLDYAEKHNDHFPTNLNDALPFLERSSNIDTNLSPDLFEIKYNGTWHGTANYAHTDQIIGLIEKQPWMNTDGKLVKIWIPLNGTGKSCCPIDGAFDAWESLHTMPQDSSNQ